MVKVIIGYRVKKDADIQPILQKLLTHAMQYSGFINADDFWRDKNHSIVMVVYTWQSAKDWAEWEKSAVRHKLLKEAETLLEDEPRVTILPLQPTIQWV